MSSPGRTHIPWQDQTGQVHELLSYISFLEAKVQYLQRHHEQCTADSIYAGSGLTANYMDLDVSYLPPDQTLTLTSEDLPLSLNSPSSMDLIINENINSSNGKFTPATIPSPQSSPEPQPPQQKILRPAPRWKRIIDLMTKDWDEPQSWTVKRIALSLDTVEGNNSALTTILNLSRPQTQSSPRQSKNDILVSAARAYAIATKTSSTTPGLMVQIHNFRELVFASLCVVMEAHGLSMPTINDLMRICMSSSGAANLYRLRRGALWVNRVIRGLMRRGWEHGATEFFLMSGKPVSQYGLLWESCGHSFPYLTDRLNKVRELVILPPADPDRIPFFIPLVIKDLVGDALSLKEICQALDYDQGLPEDTAMGSE